MRSRFISGKKKRLKSALQKNIPPIDWPAEAQNKRLQGDVKARLIPEAPGVQPTRHCHAKRAVSRKTAQNVPLCTARIPLSV